MTSVRSEFKSSSKSKQKSVSSDKALLSDSSLFIFYNFEENRNLVPDIRFDDSISSDYSVRQAMYVSMKRSANVPRLEIPDYQYCDQHQSLDKCIDSESSIFTASHLTIRYQHVKIANRFLIIHVHYDQFHVHNGSIQAKIIEKNVQRGIEQRREENYQLTDIMLKTILLHARDAENLLFKLHSVQSKKIVDLINDVVAYAKDLTSYCLDITAPYHQIGAIETAKKYNLVVQKLRNFGLDTQCDRDLNLLIQSLTKTSNPQELALSTPKSSGLKDKINGILKRIIELDEEPNKDYVSLYSHMKNIKIALLELECSDFQENTQEFIRKKRVRLSKQTDVGMLFRSRCLSGDLDFIRQIFPLIHNEIEVIDLFKNVLLTMQEPKHAEMAHYFYQNSEIVRYYMTYLNSQFHLVDSMGFSLLMEAFFSDNFELFKFLLQVSSPLTKIACMQDATGQTLSTVQALIVFFTHNPNQKYIELICTYKPNMEEIPGTLPSLEFDCHTPSARNLSGFCSVFKDLGTSSLSSKKAEALGYNMVDSNILECGVIPRVSIEKTNAICSGNQNTLQMAMSHHADTTPTLIRLIAQDCGVRMLLAEFINLMTVDKYCFDLSLSHSGGAQYVENPSLIETSCKSQNVGTIGFYFYLTEVGKQEGAAVINDNHLQRVQALIEVVTKKLLGLGEELNDFIQSRINATSVREPTEHYYLGGIFAASIAPKNRHSAQRLVEILNKLADAYYANAHLTEAMKVDAVIKNYVEFLPESEKKPRVAKIYETTIVRMQSSITPSHQL